MSVPVRELKANLSKYLKLAQSSPQGIEITSHGRAIARVVGLPAVADDSLRRLIASGAAQWSGQRPVWKPVALSAGGRSLSDMVLDDRR